MTTTESAVLAEAAELGMVFEEPPPSVNGPGRQSAWTPRLAFLRQYPGVWAKFEAKSDSLRSQVKKLDENWSVVTRMLDGTRATFVRYNGPADA